MAVPEFQAKLTGNDFDPEFLTDQEAGAFVPKKIEKWRQSAKAGAASGRN